MKRRVFPLLLIFISAIGLIATFYLIKREERIDIRQKAASGKIYTICSNTNVCNYSHINDVFPLLADGDTIQFKDNTFNGMGVTSLANPPIPNNISFTIEGGNAEPTVWTADQNYSGNGILFQIDETRNVNITVRNIIFKLSSSQNAPDAPFVWAYDNNENLKLTFSSVKVVNSKSAGIVIEGNADVKIKDCEFKNNFWPGVSARGNSTVLIENSVFKDHKHQGLDAQGSAKLIVRTSLIDSNNSIDEENTRAAIHFKENSSGEVVNCRVIDNNLNGIVTTGVSSVIVKNSEFKGNKRNGIFIDASSDILLQNNILSYNEGGIIAIGGKADVINNTITKCQDKNRRGIYIGKAIDILIKNNIIANNAGNGIHRETSGANNHTGNVNVSYNDVWNNLSNYVGLNPGVGDISLAPKFVSPDGDFHLRKSGCGSITLPCGSNCPTDCSPAIDAGDPDPQYNDPDGSRNDMGAYGGPGGERPPSTDCEVADIWGDAHTSDGKVNIYDLSKILGTWGTNDSVADIWDTKASAPHGPDGIVNTGDLSKVLGCWGWVR